MQIPRNSFLLGSGFVSLLWLVEAAIGLAQKPGVSIAWKDALKQKTEWYANTEASRIADNLVAYQRNSGGWPKNIDMARSLRESEKAIIVQQKNETDSTIDNTATYTQLVFLARTYRARPVERYREAFLRGLDYLLQAQYANGGWPQYYPDLSDYFKHITFNDGAMIGVMRVLQDVAAAQPDYVFVDQQRRARAERAVQKGVECILKTQVVVSGQRTVWCAQHDEVTLAPAAARIFEPVSLSGGESVGIVRFLMSISDPKPEVIDSIKSAVAWFEKSKLTGIRWIERLDSSKLRGFDRVVIRDPQAGPLWARFYEIRTNRPIFTGRDGVIKYDVAEIEDERRNGYAWYVDEAASLLSNDYPRWLKQQGQ